MQQRPACGNARHAEQMPASLLVQGCRGRLLEGAAAAAPTAALCRGHGEWLVLVLVGCIHTAFQARHAAASLHAGMGRGTNVLSSERVGEALCTKGWWPVGHAARANHMCNISSPLGGCYVRAVPIQSIQSLPAETDARHSAAFGGSALQNVQGGDWPFDRAQSPAPVAVTPWASSRAAPAKAPRPSSRLRIEWNCFEPPWRSPSPRRLHRQNLRAELERRSRPQQLADGTQALFLAVIAIGMATTVFPLQMAEAALGSMGDFRAMQASGCCCECARRRLHGI